MNNEAKDLSCLSESTSANQLIGFKKNPNRAKLGISGVFMTLIAGLIFWCLIPADAEQLLTRGRQMMNREPEQAALLLQQVCDTSVKLKPKAEELLCLLQVRYQKREDAIRRFEMLDLRQCSTAFLMEFSRFATKIDSESQAILALNEVAIRVSEEQIQALDTLSQIYRNQHDDKRLMDCLETLAEVSPEQPERWRTIVAFLDSRQMTTNSVEVLKTALKAKLPSRDEIEFRHQLINRLISTGRIQEAWLELESFPATESSSPRADRHRAALHRMEGKPAMALAALERSKDLNSAQPGVAWLRGQVRFDLQQYEAAKTDLLIVTAADPFDLSVHLKLAETFQALNDQIAAHEHRKIAEIIRQKRQRINRLREKFRHEPSVVIQQELAELHLQLNDLNGAAFWQQSPAGPLPFRATAH